MLQLIGYSMLLSSSPCAAVHAKTTSSLPPNQMAAFTFSSPLQARRSYERSTSFQLPAESTKQRNSFFEFIKDAAMGNNHNNGDIESVQDFDAVLAREIEDALLSAGVGSNVNLEYVIGTGGEGTPKEVTKGSTKEVTEGTTKEVTKGSTKLPIQNQNQNKAPQVPKLPPHTALAQVVANQYGIDLTTVSPSSNAPGSKISAEDVELHAWKISQPPCTAEAMELAYTLGLNLNEIYDDEDREYIIELSDVELYQECSKSLKMSSQTKKGKRSDLDPESRKLAKKERELDRRVEKNMGKLSEQAMKLAGTVTGGIVQQVQQAIGLNTSELLKEGGVLAGLNSKDTGDIKTVQDFDADLAGLIQDALSSANLNNDGANGSNDTFDQSSSAGFIGEEFVDQTPPVGIVEESLVEQSASVRFTEEELQSFTCVQLKELLRRRGLKMTGKKVELVERLLEGDQTASAANDDSGADIDEKRSPLFFANTQ